MKNNLLHFVLAVITLVFGAASEELLPKALGVGFPVLLMTIPALANRLSAASTVLLALAAGAMEDALSGLPLLTSSSYFLLVAACIRWTHLAAPISLVAMPVYQIWLYVWVPSLQGNVFGRILLSIPIGVLTAGVVAAILLVVERKAALDEAD